MKNMTRMWLGCAVVLALACGVAAQNGATAKADREAMLDHLKKSQKALDAATKGLSPEQWKFKPAPDRWSIAEVYEHITLSESGLFDMVQKGGQAPATPDKKAAAPQEKDMQVQKMVTDRSTKFPAPDFLQPTGRWSVDEMKKEFKARRAKTADFAKNNPGDMRAQFMAGPGGNELDIVQWVLFLSSHAERHTAQILEVKAEPNFPK